MSGEGVRVGQAESIRETEKAVLIKIEDEQEVWVPKSQIHDDSDVWKDGQKGTLVVSQWYAEQKGWA